MGTASTMACVLVGLGLIPFAGASAAAVSAATTGAAYSRFAESWTGSLRPGMAADFLVVDMQWNQEKLLEAKVCQTWYRGEKVFDLEKS